MADGKDRNVAPLRQNLVVIFVLIIAAIFLLRLMIMQIVEGESYRSYSDRTSKKSMSTFFFIGQKY